MAYLKITFLVIAAIDDNFGTHDASVVSAGMVGLFVN